MSNRKSSDIAYCFEHVERFGEMGFLYAIALLASGQSSTMTGIFAEQFIMQIMVVSWILMLGMSGINIYYLSTGFVRWQIHNSLPKAEKVVISILVFPLIAIYILTLIYLMFRKDIVVTFIEPLKLEHVVQMRMEGGHGNTDEVFEQNHVPFREDLSDIPFPE
ncbi:hypothetical protein RJ640_011810 [Escallonia rubra]|uniref:Uncharacterized protein n=1 Tax=Escallonia rubra TaxID=112253 RepID=A0AA88QTI6_9ASTE|nr:hypothetical protein RJ640_011810 [Escallonia rubra]